jgi:phosphopantothenoylcysteine decarboxylase/phosphopantothenate--cysteine ligase
MHIWNSRYVVLGITGSIAAYKSCELASRLVELGARVLPVLTKSAAELVGPASLEAITGQRAIVNMFEPLTNPAVEHIRVATEADLFLIAPATANVIGKVANGLANDWLSTTLLATRAPILFAPAMNTNMYEHPATQQNIATLQQRGNHFVGPGDGKLACGTVGLGRLIEIDAILDTALPLVSKQHDFKGKRVLITSGSTREPIDPVRFVGNRSSGRMGRALAIEAMARGASVTVVTGPSETPLPTTVRVERVETAEEMNDAVTRHLDAADVFIAAAAVADFRPANPFETKYKKGTAMPPVEMAENPDILLKASTHRRNGQIIVGYAAETGGLIEHALEKLERKQLDLIVANLVGGDHGGFGTPDLEAVILAPGEAPAQPVRMSKEAIAHALFNRIAPLLDRGRTVAPILA